MSGHRLLVYKADRRTRSGERFVGSYDYPSYSAEAMLAELKDLKQALYPESAGWRLEHEPMTKIVTNLMTGQPIEIDYRTPRACDPSTELYWSM